MFYLQRVVCIKCIIYMFISSCKASFYLVFVWENERIILLSSATFMVAEYLSLRWGTMRPKWQLKHDVCVPLSIFFRGCLACCESTDSFSRYLCINEEWSWLLILLVSWLMLKKCFSVLQNCYAFYSVARFHIFKSSEWSPLDCFGIWACSNFDSM